MTEAQYKRLPKYARDAIDVLRDGVNHWKRVALREVEGGESNTRIVEYGRAHTGDDYPALPDGTNVEFRLAPGVEFSGREYAAIQARVVEQPGYDDVIKLHSVDGALVITPMASNVVEVRAVRYGPKAA